MRRAGRAADGWVAAPAGAAGTLLLLGWAACAGLRLLSAGRAAWRRAARSLKRSASWQLCGGPEDEDSDARRGRSYLPPQPGALFLLDDGCCAAEEGAAAPAAAAPQPQQQPQQHGGGGAEEGARFGGGGAAYRLDAWMPPGAAERAEAKMLLL